MEWVHRSETIQLVLLLSDYLIQHNCFFRLSWFFFLTVNWIFLNFFSTGCLVKFCAPILATSKAQQLLFRIVDCLLLPHSVLQQDKELPVALLSAIQESLPLYLQVNISGLLSAHKWIFRKILILQRMFSFSLVRKHWLKL